MSEEEERRRLREWIQTYAVEGGRDPEKALKPLLDQLTSPDPQVRAEAIEITRRVIAALNAVLEDEKRARGELRGQEEDLGPEVAALRNAFQEDRWYVQGRAAGVLGAVARKLDPARVIAALIAVFEDKDEDKYIRREAVEALGAVGARVEDPTEAISALITVLKDKAEDRRIRKSAAEVLGAMGVQGVEPAQVIAALIAASQDKDRRIRESVVEALGAVGAQGVEPAQVIAAFIAVLKDKDEDRWIRKSAAEALGAVGARGEDPARVIAVLVSGLKDENTHIRESAANALGIMGANLEDPAVVIAGLFRALSEEKYIQEAVAEAFGAIAGRPREEGDRDRPVEAVITQLIGELKRGEKARRRGAAMALGEIGKRLEDRKEVVGALQGAVQDESWQVRGAVWRALEKMAVAWEELGDPRAEAAREVAVRLSMLHEEMDFEDLSFLIEYVEDLEDTSGVMPVLQEALTEEGRNVRAGVARAMALRSEAVEELEPVISILMEEIARSEYSELEAQALEAFGTISYEAQALKINLNLEAEALVTIIEKRLERIGDPAVLGPALRKSLDDEE